MRHTCLAFMVGWRKTQTKLSRRGERVSLDSIMSRVPQFIPYFLNVKLPLLDRIAHKTASRRAPWPRSHILPFDNRIDGSNCLISILPEERANTYRHQEIWLRDPLTSFLPTEPKRGGLY